MMQTEIAPALRADIDRVLSPLEARVVVRRDELTLGESVQRLQLTGPGGREFPVTIACKDNLAIIGRLNIVSQLLKGAGISQVRISQEDISFFAVPENAFR